MKIKEIIVVEGKEDSRRLKEVFKDIDTIETRGSAINDETLKIIKNAQETRGVIVFTDPDYPGQRIRSIINQHIKGCKNAYIEKEKAVSIKKKKVGIEHCSDKDIMQALSNITVQDEVSQTDVEFIDLYNLNIIGNEQSTDIRKYIGQKLNIGYNNAKQFYNKVKMFSISLDTLEQTIEEYYNQRQK
jgi:ribonuclease M5